MPAIKLYGTALSRAARSLIALEELGLAYEHIPLKPRPGTQDREFLQTINPNLHVPVLEHDGLIVWESMAINFFLGDLYGGPLWPKTAQERAAMYQWSIWAQTEMDRRDWESVRRSGDAQRIADVLQQKVATLRVLDAALDRGYLLGETFSFADLNVASSLSQPNEGGKIDWQRVDPAEFGLQRLADWLRRCTSRDSWRAVGRLQ
ncbi:MAG TPA: glutathione S-transferase family protein [Polyangiales bacterium]|nr:glutathione S-transferase family protein [Polyangiales bacterium]